MLRIDHACYRYAPSDSWALDDASVTIEPGEHVVLLGRNGSGKSTLAQLANGSLLPQRGCVSIDGVGIGAAGSDEADGLAEGDASYAASRVAFVRQDPRSQLVSSVVSDEVAFGPRNLGLSEDEVRARVAEALESCGLASLRSCATSTLSGGQQQRLALAGALAMHPAYIVLDEVTSQLDSPARRSLRAVIDLLTDRGAGVLEVSHLVEDVACADRAVVMDCGRTIWSGAPTDLLASGDLLVRSGLVGLGSQLAALFARSGCNVRSLYALSVPEMVEFARKNDFVDDLSHLVCQPRICPQKTSREQDSPESGLTLADVSLDYGTTLALDELSVSVSPGELLLVAGLSGSGKTSASLVAAGLLPPDGGDVSLGGGPVEPGMVGLSFQRPEDQLFCDAVESDVAYGPLNLGLSEKEALGRAHAALGRLGVGPQRFGVSPLELSGGERRRVALAGIVALDPGAYVFDEPTAGLDGDGRSFLHELVASLVAQGAPVVVVTHDVGEWLGEATKVALLRDGWLAWSGLACDLATSSTPFARAGLDAPLSVRLREVFHAS